MRPQVVTIAGTDRLGGIQHLWASFTLGTTG